MSAAAARPRRGLLARLAAIDDGNIMRAAFYLLLAGTLAVVWVDYRERSENDAAAAPAATAPAFPAVPFLPGLMPDAPTGAPSPRITTDRAMLEAPLTVTLTSGGVLALTGTIDPGAPDRFEAEVAAHREYIRTVALDSPGGSVEDAMRIGRALREAGFATSVAAGALCASSCPLVLAAGTTRSAAPGAAIGVHQIYAALDLSGAPAGWKAAALGMSKAQRMTAIVTRYLTEMGVDPTLWLHALETPPESLYYLTAEEMTSAGLATPPAKP
jgi:hypothetical protein